MNVSLLGRWAGDLGRESPRELREGRGPGLGGVALGELERPLARPLTECLVLRDADERPAQRMHVLDRDAEAVHALLDQVMARPRRLRRDQRKSRRGRLLPRHTPCPRAPRHYVRVRGRVPAEQLVPVYAADQADAVAGERLDLRSVGPVADEDELAGDAVEGLGQYVDALLRREPAHAEEGAAVEPQLSPELLSPFAFLRHVLAEETP